LNNIENSDNQELMTPLEKLKWLSTRIELLETEISNLKMGSSDTWVPLPVAANILDKSVSAVRQRIKRKDKPMPQGKVWKQEAKGYEIFINLKNYRKYM